MDEEEKRKILEVYPQFDEVYGPYPSLHGKPMMKLYRKRLPSARRTTTTRLLARLRLEARLGRELRFEEKIVYLDGDRQNTAADNLQLKESLV